MRATGGQTVTGGGPRARLAAVAAGLTALAGLALAPAAPALAQSAAPARPASSASTSPATDSATAGNVLIVISEVTQKVTFIGPSWRVTRSLGDPNGSPDSIAVSPDGKFALVGIAGYQNNELVIFGGADSPDPKITGRIDLGDFSYPEASAAAITPNDEYAYVPGAGEIDNGSYTVGVVSGVNTDDPQLSDSLMLNPATSIDASIPCGIAISPNGKYAYATDYSFGTLTVITGAQDGHPKLAKPVQAGASACQIWAAPDGKYLYKRNPDGSKITVLGDADSTTPKILDTVSAGSEPANIAVTPDGKYLYAPSGDSDKVAILGDAQSAHPKVVASVVGGADSDGVVTSADGQYAYVADGASGKITVIGDAQGAHPAVKPDISVPGSAELIGVAPITVGIYSDFTPQKGKHPYARVTKALTDQHWPLIGNVAALSAKAKCKSPYTVGTGSDKAVASVLGSYQKDQSVNVPWLSFWTVDAPPKGSNPESVGRAAGEAAARSIEKVGRGGEPTGRPYVILDPEGQKCGNGAKGESVGNMWNGLPTVTWQALVTGWDEGVTAADPDLTPAVYLTKYQYQKKDGVGYPQVFLAATDSSGKHVPGVAPMTGGNILGYNAFYAACGAATADIAEVKTWGAPYNTLQFTGSEICAP